MKKRFCLFLSIILTLGIACLGFSFVDVKGKEAIDAKAITYGSAIEMLDKGNCVEKGGAIYLASGSTYNMSKGTIKGHVAEKGGAIYIGNGAKFTMTGGTITGNYAKYGGAIYVASGGECYINGGTITGNYAENAPAIYVEDGGILKISSTALVKDNYYLEKDIPINIYVDGALATTIEKTGTSYTIDESEMPLDYEHCCGYFYDEKLSMATNGVVDLKKEFTEATFAPRTATATTRGINIYTKTASAASNFIFTLNETTGTYDIKASSTSISGHIVLPKEYNNVQTSICAAETNETSFTGGAFPNCQSITGITFQDGLKTISHCAFYNGFGLTGELIIPDSVTTIGVGAFFNCYSITGSLVIPNKVTTINDHAFTMCMGFSGDLIIPNSVITIGESAFAGCRGLTGNLTIGDSVSSIGNSAFESGGFTGELVIPESVTSIGEYSFEGTGFTGELIIPSKVTNIGKNAFSECMGITSVYIPKTVVTIDASDCSNSPFYYGADGMVIYTNVENEDSVPSGWGEYWNNQNYGVKYLTIYACSSDGDNIIIPKTNINIYVDRVLTITLSKIGESYTIDESEMPLDYEHCCGYFYDERLSMATNGVVDLSAEGDVNIYTKTASAASNFIFTLNETTGTYDIKASSTDITGNIVLPKEYNNVQTSLCSGEIIDEEFNVGGGAFPYCTGITSITFQDGLTTISDCSIAHCSGLTGNLVIPDCVTTIGLGAFGMCTSITGDLIIPDSVRNLGMYAFAGCQGFNGGLILSENLTEISAYAFYTCAGLMGSLTIPNGVETIGESAFMYCEGFTGNLIIPNSVITIGNYSFRGCDGITGTLTIGNRVTEIGEYAFRSTNFTGDLVIPDSVLVIGKKAFEECYDFSGTLTIGKNVTNIGQGAFFRCGFIGTLTLPNSVTRIGEYAFEGCEGIETVFIPSSVTIIYASYSGGSPFGNCSSDLIIYTDVADENSVPDGWDEYWNYRTDVDIHTTVYGCSLDDYGNVVTPNKINIYVDGALSKKIYVNGSEYWINEEDMPLDYESCCGYFLDSNLSRTADSYIYMGNGDVNLYTKTASDPNNFLFIYNETTGTYDIKAVNTSISGRIVLPKEYDNVQTSLYIGTFDSELNVSDGSFPYCTGITSITLQHGLTTISDCSFAYCSGITERLIIPDCVNTIGIGAFGMCAGISGSLAIPNSVTTIGDYSFTGCTGFNGNLTIGNNVTTIGGHAFWVCNGFTGDLVIPDSVTSIGRTAFSECSGFDGELVIGAGLTTIEWQTFQHCSGFTGDLIIPDNVTYVDDYAFNGCIGFNGRLVLSKNLSKIAIESFYGCSGLTGNLNIPSGVTSIGYDAFAGCSGFTGVLEIPSSVTDISMDAFKDCSGFVSFLIIPSSVTYIGEYAFAGCTGIDTAYVPTSVTTISGYSWTGDTSTNSIFYGCADDLVIYTGYANASSIPDTWNYYWNYKSSTETFLTKYGYSLVQYKEEVGIAITVFAPQNGLNDNFFNEFEIETVKTKGFNISFSNDYEQYAILNEEKEYVALLKENEKSA